MQRRKGVLLAALATLTLAACGSGGAAKPRSARATKVETPAQVLARARAVLDGTSAVHFTLTSTGVSPHGIQIVSGSGDLARPNQLAGSFSVSISGLDATVKVVSTGGTFYAEPPFQTTYSVTNPASYGLGNPAQLLAQAHGVSALLTEQSGIRALGPRRLQGELLDAFSGTVPGTDIPVLPDANRSRPVTIVASIDPVNFQLRQVSLAGPFTSASTTTTYTVTLTGYGEHVSITAPRL